MGRTYRKQHGALEEERKLRKEIEAQLAKTKAELERKTRLLELHKQFLEEKSCLEEEKVIGNVGDSESINVQEELRSTIESNIKQLRMSEERNLKAAAQIDELTQNYEEAKNVIANNEYIIKQLNALNEQKTEEINNMLRIINENKKKTDLSSSCQPRFISSLKHAIAFGKILETRVCLSKKKKLWLSTASIWLDQLGEKKLNLDGFIEDDKTNESIGGQSKSNSCSDRINKSEIDGSSEELNLSRSKHEQNLIRKDDDSSSWKDEGIGSPQLSIISQTSSSSDTSTNSTCSSNDSGIVVDVKSSTCEPLDNYNNLENIKNVSDNSYKNNYNDVDKEKENMKLSGKSSLPSVEEKDNSLPEIDAVIDLQTANRSDGEGISIVNSKISEEINEVHLNETVEDSNSIINSVNQDQNSSIKMNKTSKSIFDPDSYLEHLVNDNRTLECRNVSVVEQKQSLSSLLDKDLNSSSTESCNKSIDNSNIELVKKIKINDDKLNQNLLSLQSSKHLVKSITDFESSLENISLEIKSTDCSSNLFENNVVTCKPSLPRIDNNSFGTVINVLKSECKPTSNFKTVLNNKKGFEDSDEKIEKVKNKSEINGSSVEKGRFSEIPVSCSAVKKLPNKSSHSVKSLTLCNKLHGDGCSMLPEGFDVLEEVKDCIHNIISESEQTIIINENLDCSKEICAEILTPAEYSNALYTDNISEVNDANDCIKLRDVDEKLKKIIKNSKPITVKTIEFISGVIYIEKYSGNICVVRVNSLSESNKNTIDCSEAVCKETRKKEAVSFDNEKKNDCRNISSSFVSEDKNVVKEFKCSSIERKSDVSNTDVMKCKDLRKTNEISFGIGEKAVSEDIGKKDFNASLNSVFNEVPLTTHPKNANNEFSENGYLRKTIDNNPSVNSGSSQYSCVLSEEIIGSFSERKRKDNEIGDIKEIECNLSTECSKQLNRTFKNSIDSLLDSHSEEKTSANTFASKFEADKPNGKLFGNILPSCADSQEYIFKRATTRNSSFSGISKVQKKRNRVLDNKFKSFNSVPISSLVSTVCDVVTVSKESDNTEKNVIKTSTINDSINNSKLNTSNKIQLKNSLLGPKLKRKIEILSGTDKLNHNSERLSDEEVHEGNENNLDAIDINISTFNINTSPKISISETKADIIEDKMANNTNKHKPLKNLTGKCSSSILSSNKDTHPVSSNYICSENVVSNKIIKSEENMSYSDDGEDIELKNILSKVKSISSFSNVRIVSPMTSPRKSCNKNGYLVQQTTENLFISNPVNCSDPDKTVSETLIKEDVVFSANNSLTDLKKKKSRKSACINNSNEHCKSVSEHCKSNSCVKHLDERNAPVVYKNQNKLTNRCKNTDDSILKSIFSDVYCPPLLDFLDDSNSSFHSTDNCSNSKESPSEIVINSYKNRDFGKSYSNTFSVVKPVSYTGKKKDEVINANSIPVEFDKSKCNNQELIKTCLGEKDNCYESYNSNVDKSSEKYNNCESSNGISDDCKKDNNCESCDSNLDKSNEKYKNCESSHGILDDCEKDNDCESYNSVLGDSINDKACQIKCKDIRIENKLGENFGSDNKNHITDKKFVKSDERNKFSVEQMISKKEEDCQNIDGFGNENYLMKKMNDSYDGFEGFGNEQDLRSIDYQKNNLKALEDVISRLLNPFFTNNVGKVHSTEENLKSYTLFTQISSNSLASKVTKSLVDDEQKPLSDQTEIKNVSKNELLLNKNNSEVQKSDRNELECKELFSENQTVLEPRTSIEKKMKIEQFGNSTVQSTVETANLSELCTESTDESPSRLVAECHVCNPLPRRSSRLLNKALKDKSPDNVENKENYSKSFKSKRKFNKKTRESMIKEKFSINPCSQKKIKLDKHNSDPSHNKTEFSFSSCKCNKTKLKETGLKSKIHCDIKPSRNTRNKVKKINKSCYSDCGCSESNVSSAMESIDSKCFSCSKLISVFSKSKDSNESISRNNQPNICEIKITENNNIKFQATELEVSGTRQNSEDSLLSVKSQSSLRNELDKNEIKKSSNLKYINQTEDDVDSVVSNSSNYIQTNVERHNSNDNVIDFGEFKHNSEMLLDQATKAHSPETKSFKFNNNNKISSRSTGAVLKLKISEVSDVSNKVTLNEGVETVIDDSASAIEDLTYNSFGEFKNGIKMPRKILSKNESNYPSVSLDKQTIPEGLCSNVKESVKILPNERNIECKNISNCKTEQLKNENESFNDLNNEEDSNFFESASHSLAFNLANVIRKIKKDSIVKNPTKLSVGNLKKPRQKELDGTVKHFCADDVSSINSSHIHRQPQGKNMQYFSLNTAQSSVKNIPDSSVIISRNQNYKVESVSQCSSLIKNNVKCSEAYSCYDSEKYNLINPLPSEYGCNEINGKFVENVSRKENFKMPFYYSSQEVNDEKDFENIKSPSYNSTSPHLIEPVLLFQEKTLQETCTNDMVNEVKNDTHIPYVNFYTRDNNVPLCSKKRKSNHTILNEETDEGTSKKVKENFVCGGTEKKSLSSSFSNSNNYNFKDNDIVQEKIPCCDSVLKTAFNYHKESLLSNPSDEKSAKIREVKDGQKGEKLLCRIQQLCEKLEPLSNEFFSDMLTNLKSCGQQAVAEIFIDLLCVDEEDSVENFIIPVTPLQKYLFPFAYHLSCDSNYADFLLIFLKCVKSTLFNDYEKCMVKPSQNLAKFSTLLCRSLHRFEEMRWFIFDVLYMLRYKSDPIIYTMLIHWPSLMPYARNAIECPLSFCISHVINNRKITSKCNAKLYKNYELKSLMKQLYGYRLGEMTSDQALDHLFKFISKNGFQEAVTLLCKREGYSWAADKINKIFLPMLDSWQKGIIEEKTAIIIIITLGYVMRPFPPNAAQQVMYDVIKRLEQILQNVEGSADIQETVVLSICHLSRLNFEICIDVIQRWKPKNGQISKSVIEAMKSVIAVKKPLWWQKYFSNYRFMY